MLCWSGAQTELQRKHVAGGQQRFGGRNRLLCVTAESLPCLLAVWVLNCVFASLMAPAERVRGWVSFQVAKRSCERSAAWDIPPSQRGFLAWGRPDSRGISKGQLGQSPGALGAASWAFRKSFKLWLGVGRLRGPQKVSSHQRASFWFLHVPSLRVEAHLAQVRQKPPPHQSDTGLRLLQWN